MPNLLSVSHKDEPCSWHAVDYDSACFDVYIIGGPDDVQTILVLPYGKEPHVLLDHEVIVERHLKGVELSNSELADAACRVVLGRGPS